MNKIKDTKEYVNELRHILISKITMLETFYSKIVCLNSEVKGRINKNNTSDSLIKIIEYMDIYRKRLKTILDYQRNSHKTLRAYEVGNKPNNTKASKKKQRKKRLN